MEEHSDGDSGDATIEGKKHRSGRQKQQRKVGKDAEKEVPPVEDEKPKAGREKIIKRADAVEATLGDFTLDVKPSLSNMVNKENGYYGERPVVVLTVIIDLKSNGGTAAGAAAALG